MTDLSPGSRNILTEGVRALEPSQAARDRIRAGVAARIAVLPGAGGAGESGQAAGGASATSGAAGTIFKASLLAVIGAVVVGGGVMWFAGGDDPVVPTAARAPAVAAPAPEPALRAGRARAGGAGRCARSGIARIVAPLRVAARRKAAESRRDGAAKRSSQASSVSDDLAREVRLLDRARRALTDGDPDAARAALARYRREIASPQMERESLLLRAETQCAAAETDAGLRTLAEVRRRWPGASGVDAVRALCREAAR